MLRCAAPHADSAVVNDLARILDDLSEQYLSLHRAKEQAFWDTRMGIADRHRELAEGDLALREFLADPGRLRTLRGLKSGGDATPAQAFVLDGWILMFSRNQVEDEEARGILKEIVDRETALQQARGEMELGYCDARGSFVSASSVALSNDVRTNPDADTRRAAFEGLRTIETFALANGYLEIVKLRNRFARRLGFEDFYDYKVRWAEGFDKRTLFAFLAPWRSRGTSRTARGAARSRRSAIRSCVSKTPRSAGFGASRGWASVSATRA